MHPSHESGMHVAHRIRQNLPHKAAMKRREIRRFPRQGLPECLTRGAGNGLPDGPLADMFRVVQHVVEHAMCLSPKTGPIRWVERSSIWRWRCLLLQDVPEEQASPSPDRATLDP